MLIAALVALAGFTASGCFTTTSDFRNDAKKSILTSRRLAGSVGVTFTSAECESPASQAVGTTFRCTAVDDAGKTWEFEAKITGTHDYEVNISRYPTATSDPTTNQTGSTP
jgi:hypothetical protein